jgi:hypothetical protein
MKAVSLSAMFFIVAIFVSMAAAQTKPDAPAIVSKAVQVMGGERYLQVKTQIGRGRFSSVREGSVHRVPGQGANRIPNRRLENDPDKQR